MLINAIFTVKQELINSRQSIQDAKIKNVFVNPNHKQLSSALLHANQ